MDFRPSKWKVIISIVFVILIFFIINILILFSCASAKLICLQDCPNTFSFIANCCGCGSTFIENMQQFVILLSPGMLVYIIWSLFNRKID